MSVQHTRFPSPLVGEGAERRSREAGEGACRQAPTPMVATRKPGVPVVATPNNAQSLRRSMTDAEKKRWRALRARQLVETKFRRQVPVGPYVADFLCFASRLVVDVDGGQHADSARDKLRDRWFGKNGFRILRFWNNDVLRNLEGVLTVIDTELGRSPPHPDRAARGRPSPARGEGKKAVT